MGQAVGSGGLECAVQRAAQLGDLDEVVEVPGLQLASCRLSTKVSSLRAVGGQLVSGDASQAADDRGAEQRHGAGAALGVEGGELGEVVAADLLVGDAAAQAEGERGGHEPGRQARRRRRRRVPSGASDRPSSGRYLRLLSRIVDLAGRRVGDRARTPGSRPVGQRVVRPGQVAADVQVAGDGCRRRWRRRRGGGRTLARPLAVDLGDDEVLLAALAAEPQRQQRLVGLVRAR